MTIGIRIKLPGVTQAQFDAAHDHINPERTPPKGLVFHASGPIDDGWGIIDFWESRADFDAFQGRIAEGAAAAGRRDVRASGHQGVPRPRDDRGLESANGPARYTVYHSLL